MNMSFYTGAARSRTVYKKLSVVSNNLSNINNTGFKPKTIAFSELIHYNLNDSENAQTELEQVQETRGERTWTDFGVAGATQTGKNMIMQSWNLMHFLCSRILQQVRSPIQETPFSQGRKGRWLLSYNRRRQAGAGPEPATS